MSLKETELEDRSDLTSPDPNTYQPFPPLQRPKLHNKLLSLDDKQGFFPPEPPKVIRVPVYGKLTRSNLPKASDQEMQRIFDSSLPGIKNDPSINVNGVGKQPLRKPHLAKPNQQNGMSQKPVDDVNGDPLKIRSVTFSELIKVMEPHIFAYHSMQNDNVTETKTETPAKKSHVTAEKSRITAEKSRITTEKSHIPAEKSTDDRKTASTQKDEVTEFLDKFAPKKYEADIEKLRLEAKDSNKLMLKIQEGMRLRLLKVEDCQKQLDKMKYYQDLTARKDLQVERISSMEQAARNAGCLDQVEPVIQKDVHFYKRLVEQEAIVCHQINMLEADFDAMQALAGIPTRTKPKILRPKPDPMIPILNIPKQEGFTGLHRGKMQGNRLCRKIPPAVMKVEVPFDYHRVVLDQGTSTCNPPKLWIKNTINYEGCSINNVLNYMTYITDII